MRNKLEVRDKNADLNDNCVNSACAVDTASHSLWKCATSRGYISGRDRTLSRRLWALLGRCDKSRVFSSVITFIVGIFSESKLSQSNLKT